jgi:hypothetical protein
VQDAAADLLAHLPDSQLVARMTSQVLPLLILTGLVRPSLQVTLPDKLDDAMQRDAVQRDAIRPGKAPAPLQLGEKAWALCQMLACVPPTVWSKQWGKSPDSLLAMAARSEAGDLLREGWRRATLRHPQVEWAGALIAHGAEARELIDALPPAQREPCIMALVQAKAYRDSATLFIWLGACHQAWSLNYGRLVLNHVRQQMSQSSSSDWRMTSILPDYACYFPPQLLSEAEAAWQPHPDTAAIWQPRIKQFMDLLYFRQEMLAALKSADHKSVVHPTGSEEEEPL